MKKLCCIILCCTLGVSSFALNRQIRDYKRSLRYMFIGQTVAAESVFPFLAMATANVVLLNKIRMSQQYMTSAVILDSMFIAPFIAGVAVYLKGMSLFNQNNRNADRYVSKLLLYMTKLRMFRIFIGVNSSLTGLGSLMFVPGVVMTAAWYYGHASMSILSLMICGFVCLAVSLPMLMSSLLMVAWIKESRLRLTPVIGLSRDEWKNFWEYGVRGYTLKLGFKMKL